MSSPPHVPVLTGRLRALAWVAIGIWGVSLALWAAGFGIDDVYITYRVARNMAAGHGPVFNPGDPVEAYSNFLWVLLLAGAARLGVAIPLAARALGLLAACGAAFAAGRLGELLFGVDRLASVAALVGLVSFWVWPCVGLETPLFACLVAMAAVQALEPEGSTGLLAALLVAVLLCRVDGAAYVVVFAAWGLATGSRRVARAAGLALLVGLGYHLWRLGYHGDLRSAPMLAKGATGVWRRLRGGVGCLVSFLSENGGWLLPAASLVLLARAGRRGALVLALVGLQVAFVLYTRGGWMPGFRYLVPAAVLLAPGMAAALSRVMQPLGPERAGKAVLVALGLQGVFVALLAVRLDMGDYRRSTRAILADYRSAAAYIEAHAAPGALVAVQDVGYTSWLLPERPVLDLWGLADATVARLKQASAPSPWNLTFGLGAVPQAQPAYQQGFAAYVVARAPAYLVYVGHAGAGDLGLVALEKAPAFLAAYRLVEDAALPAGITLWARRSASP